MNLLSICADLSIVLFLGCSSSSPLLPSRVRADTFLLSVAMSLRELGTHLFTCHLSLSAKVVDLDPCLSKKPLEEKPSQPYSARESLSEVQSLSSFQSESCDDNGRFQMLTLDAVAALKCCCHSLGCIPTYRHIYHR